ncbi:MAG: Npt1/Npt2 family nucleotide transporter [Myxococcota bacterium]|nr:Npt1/Npt2 family nucleotide transporter [Myxococcota bacterium]
MSKKRSRIFTSLDADFDDEVKDVVAFNLQQSFFLGIPRAFTLSAASALFLESFDSSQIPYAYLASAAFVTLLGLAFLKLEKASGFIKTAIYFTVALFVITIGLRLGFDHILPRRVICFVLFVWAEAEWNLTNVIFWTVANNSFTVREAKKVFGLISAGEILPLIVGGAVVPLFVNQIGVINLLWFSAFGYAAAYMNLQRFQAQLRKPSSHSRHEASEESGPISPSQRKYVYQIAFILIANCVVFYFVDNFFLDQTHKQISKANDYAAFMGGFVFIIGVFQLITKVFISNRILKNWGIGKALLVTPLSVFVLMLASFILLKLNGSVSVMFVAAVALKVTERSLATGVNSPAFYVLFQPLSDSHKTRVQGFLDTIITQVASLAGGALLLLIQDYLELGVTGITGVGLLVVLAWVWVGMSAGKHYKDALRQSLDRRQYGDADAITFGPEAENLVVQQLYSDKPSRVTYALRLLNEVNAKRAAENFERLFVHGPHLVRQSVLQYIEQSPDKKFADSIASSLAHSKDHQYLEIGIFAVSACLQQECLTFAQPYLEHPDTRIQDSALTALLKYGGARGINLARAKIESLFASNKFNEQVRAVDIIINSKTTEFAHEIHNLLNTESAQGKRIAIAATGATATVISTEFITNHINIQSLRGPLKNACLNIGEPAVQVLIDSFNDNKLRWSSKKEIIETLGKLQSSQALEFLISLFETPDRDLRTSAFRALGEATDDNVLLTDKKTLLAEILEEEARSYTQILAFIRDLQPLDDSAVLRTSLESELRKTEERIYLILQLYYERELSSSLEQALQSGSKSESDLAFELLENTISERERTFLPTILEKQTPGRKLSQLQNAFGIIESVDWAVRLSELIMGRLPWNNTWLSTCAKAIAEQNNIPILESTETDFDLDVAGTQELVRREQKGTYTQFVNDVGVFIGSHYFSGLSTYRLSVLCTSAKQDILRQGQQLQLNSSTEPELVVVVDGHLRDHERQYQKGDLIGEFDIFFSSFEQKQLHAISDTRIYRLSKSQLLAVMTEETGFAWHIIEQLCDRLQTNAQTREVSSFAVLNSPRQTKAKSDLLETLFLLRTIDLFNTLDDYVLRDFISAAEHVSYEPGVPIFVKGEKSTHLVITLNGSVKVHEGSKLLAELRDPSILGEISAIMAGPRSASVTAVTEVDCLILKRSALHSILWRQPELVYSLVRMLAERLEQNIRVRATQ